MHRLKWKSGKFSFQSLHLIVLLSTIVTSNASALRIRRETNEVVLPKTESTSEYQQHVMLSSSTTSTESNFIGMESAELEQKLFDSEMAIDVDTEVIPALVENGEAKTEMIVTLLSQEQANSNVSTTWSTAVKDADVTMPGEILADVTTTAKTATIGSTSTGSTWLVATTTPKLTTNSLPVTTLSQKLDAIETTTAETDNVATQLPLVSPVDVVGQSVTGQLVEIEENTTTDGSTDLDSLPVTRTIVAEITTTETQPLLDVNASRSPSDMSPDTIPPPARFEDTTIKNADNEIGTTLINPDITLPTEIQTTIGHSIDTATDQSETEMTTIRDPEPESTTMNESITTSTTATIYQTTIEAAREEAETDKANYDVAINEIKNNSTIKDKSMINGESQPRHKFVEEEQSAVTTTVSTITSTSVKTRTTKAHKFINSPETLKTNQVDDIKPSNYSFTSTGSGVANSIENTLEAGQIDDTVLNKIGDKGSVAQIAETKQAIRVMNSTPTIADIIIPSTPSIERNKVESDVDEATVNTRFSGSHQLTTTERVQNAIASSIEPSISTDNKTTEEPMDTTTKRVERSTSTPAIVDGTTQQNVVNMTTASNFTPLSANPIDRVSPTTNAVTGSGYTWDADRGISTTTEVLHDIESDKLPATTLAAAILPATTSNSPVPTIESSESNVIITSTTGILPTHFTASLPSTTSTQSVKQIPTKARMKPFITKDTPPPTMNTTHIVSTERIEEYSIQPRFNPTMDSNTSEGVTLASISATATTTPFPASESTEKVTTNERGGETDYNVIIAISVSVVGIVALILLVGFLYVMRKRQKSISYGQRCRPVSLDAYSLDNVSIFNSVRRKGASRASKRSYGNAAFDDPSLKHNSMGIHELAKFVDRRMTIHEEFKDVPQIIARPDEVPPGCEDKNRYANVIPLPETRVVLSRIGDDERSEYINANFARGPKDPANYYIACQAPLESTVNDFWRMIWEQNSRVIIMATDLIENGVEKCAEYLPATMTLDNYAMHGDFQITLKSREVKDKYAVSTLHVKNVPLNRWREITHFWYQWPESGVPADETSVIAMLLDARSYLKMGTPEQSDEETEKAKIETNGTASSLDKTKSLTKTQGPLTVHCSPGTGRTGTLIACDIALRSLEMPKRIIDIPQFVYFVRRGRASAVQTKEQYEFIYKVAHMYATKISGPINDN